MAIKILHVIKSLGRGGAETLLPETLRLHDKQQFEFSCVYFLPWKNQLVNEIEAAGGAVTCLSASNNLAIVLRARSLASWIRRHKIDIVHAHLPWAGVVARIAGRLASVPVIYTEHNKQERYHFATRLINLATIGLNRLTIAVSNDVGDSIRRSRGGLSNILTILNGVNTTKFERDDEARRAVRARFGIHDNEILIGNISVFRPQKRLDVWLDVAAAIKKRNPAIQFMIVGDGPMGVELRERRSVLGADSYVHMPGLQENVLPFYSAFDMLMISSEFEGLPIALLEAMATRLPVVATRAGGIGEVVRDGTDGFLCSVGQPSQLESLVMRFAENPLLLKSLGENARQRVVDSFSLETMVSELESLYRSIVFPDANFPTGK